MNMICYWFFTALNAKNVMQNAKKMSPTVMVCLALVHGICLKKNYTAVLKAINVSMITVDCAPGEYWVPLPQDDPILNPFDDEDNGWCKKCDIGYFQDKKKQDTQHKCPDGKTTENEGTAREEDCKSKLLYCFALVFTI